MADEANVAQGDTTAAVGSSDNASQEQGQQGAPAANVAAQGTGGQDAGLLGGNNVEKKDAAPVEGDAGAKSEGEDKGGEEGDNGLSDFTIDETLGFGADEQEFFKSQAKEAGFNQEQAQKAVDMFANGFKAYREAQTEAQKEAFEKFKTENTKEWTDKPDHQNLTLLADKAAQKLGVKEYLMETGYVHDAKLLSAFAELGRLMSESTAITGDGAGGGPKQPQQILWPNMK